MITLSEVHFALYLLTFVIIVSGLTVGFSMYKDRMNVRIASLQQQINDMKEWEISKAEEKADALANHLDVVFTYHPQRALHYRWTAEKRKD